MGLCFALVTAFTAHAQSTVTISSATTIADDDFSYDGNNLIVESTTLTISGAHQFENIELRGTAVLTTTTASSTSSPILDLQANALTVESGASIDLDGHGLLSSDASSYSGGSYGGLGGTLSNNENYVTNPTYGDVYQPTDYGRGGYYNTSYRTRGGGVLKLQAQSLALEGTIRSNGGYHDRSGGGSGGSIWIQAGTVSGSGTVQANGGGGGTYYDSGGGGGGRIALYYDSLNGFDPAAQISAVGGVKGGNGREDGGAGTIYLKDNAASQGTVIVNNGALGNGSAATVLPGSVFNEPVVLNQVRIDVTGDVLASDVSFADSIIEFGGESNFTSLEANSSLLNFVGTSQIGALEADSSTLTFAQDAVINTLVVSGGSVENMARLEVTGTFALSDGVVLYQRGDLVIPSGDVMTV
ncbi:hypothetical protein HCU74_11210, partial [Spongiibacter sp. KMU-166]|nr:hypothetical protein [Spongiibacter thalassae]